MSQEDLDLNIKRLNGEKRFISVIQDHFSKYVFLDALSQKTSKEVVEALNKALAVIGPPAIL